MLSLEINNNNNNNTREREHLDDPGVDGKIILRWMFRKWDVGA